MASDRWKTPALAVALFLGNALLTARLFRIEYTNEMGSIEAAFIGLAHYIRAHFPDLYWFPLWYGGIPYQDSYPPVLHFLVAMAPLAPGLAYHAVTATLYASGPAALFWAAWRLGAARSTACTAALLYSLISPSCFLVRAVRNDAGGWFGPRRLITLVRYGEGPHIASLLFLPLAVALVAIAVRKRRPFDYVLAAAALAAVVLSNWIGAFALAVALAALALSLPRRVWPHIAGIGALAYAFALPWAPPSTLATIRANAPLVGGHFEPNLVLAGGFAGSFLLLAWLLPARVRFAGLFLYGMAFLTLAAYWLGWIVLPQPHRYQLEMDMAFWLAAALLVPRLPRPACLAVMAVCIPVFLHQRSMARAMERPAAIRSTAEYQTATWLDAHLPGRRIFAPGTIGFWMNAFGDTPMLNGGFDNGIRNTFLQDVIFQIYAGDKQQVMLDWLNAFGCDAIVGGDPQSREVYHPYAHAGKFEGLAELWRDGPEVIYDVPRRRRSLAHAILAADLPQVRPPGYDTALLQPYLKALDDPSRPDADFHWQSQHSASIAARLRPEHLLSVQVTWDEGWTARVDGQTRRAWSDKLGQVVVEPRCDGACVVELTWDGGREMRLARWTSGLAFAGSLIWVLLWRKRSASTTTN